jgi:hypothetical protein
MQPVYPKDSVPKRVLYRPLCSTDGGAARRNRGVFTKGNKGARHTYYTIQCEDGPVR